MWNNSILGENSKYDGVSCSGTDPKKACGILRKIFNLEAYISRIMPKLRTYNILKTNWELPSYVKKYLTRIQRAHVAKLFSGNLPLRVETGRYRSIPLENRLCTHCNLNQVEDEIHFITSCELYTDIRVTLAESNGIDLAVDNISELFVNICNNVPPKDLAQFIITAMQRRRISPTLWI